MKTDTVIYCGKPSKAIQIMDSLIDKLSNKGTLFVVCSTEYFDNSDVKTDFLDVIHKAVEKGLHYINTIVYPTKNVQHVSFNDNVRYAVWLCKDKDNYLFNKDAVREKHIWKDVEWGKRTKNYNSKGKDPGNVWIPTLDDGKAHIVDHVLLSDEEVINRLINMTSSTNSNQIIKDEFCNRCITTLFAREKKAFDDLFGDVIFGSSEKMNRIADKSVACVITSPPYWNLKDYFKKGQIGQESYEQYISRMKKVWSECYLKNVDDGTLWININIRVNKSDVVLIPYDIIKSCKEVGYHYKGIVIWHKSSGIPGRPNNLGDHHEYVLLFSKKDNFVVKNDLSLIKDYKNEDINNGAFWNINRKAGSVGKQYIHPAIYPNGLVSRIVLLSTYEKEIVVDPFLGSGTTMISSIRNNRSCCGYEYNEGFKDLMNSRFSSELQDCSMIKFR